MNCLKNQPPPSKGERSLKVSPQNLLRAHIMPPELQSFTSFEEIPEPEAIDKADRLIDEINRKIKEWFR